MTTSATGLAPHVQIEAVVPPPVRVRSLVDRPTKWSMTYFPACLFAPTPAVLASPSPSRANAPSVHLPAFLPSFPPSDSAADSDGGGGVGPRTPNHPLNLFTLFYGRPLSATV